MQAAEFAVLDWIQGCRCGFLDTVMPVISAVCAHGEVWIAAAILLLMFKRTRRVGIAVAAALALDVICCNGILKPLIGRLRPCEIRTAFALLVPRPTDASFPSGHAASSFAATAAMYASGSRWWIPALVLTVLICFSRLYLYVHWPSDILGGAALGIALGFLGHRETARLERRLRERKHDV